MTAGFAHIHIIPLQNIASPTYRKLWNVETVVLHKYCVDALRMFTECNKYYTTLNTMSELKIAAYCVIEFNVL